MDFGFTEEQLAVRQAAVGIFAGLVSPDRVAEVEEGDDRFDRELWAELAKANLLGLAIPEPTGRGRLRGHRAVPASRGPGRAVAPVPLWATVVLGALPVAQFGTPEQRPGGSPASRPARSALRRPSGSAESTSGRPPVRAEPAGGAGGSSAPSWPFPKPTWPPGCWCRPTPPTARWSWPWSTRPPPGSDSNGP